MLKPGLVADDLETANQAMPTDPEYAKMEFEVVCSPEKQDTAECDTGMDADTKPQHNGYTSAMSVDNFGWKIHQVVLTMAAERLLVVQQEQLTVG